MSCHEWPFSPKKHDAEYKMTNIFGVSHILQFISPNFQKKKQQQDMRHCKNYLSY